MTSDDLALLGAITGIFGTFLAGIGLYLHWRAHKADSAKLLISSVMGLSQTDNDDIHPYINITLRNAGRRIIRIHSIWVDIPEKIETITNPDGSKVPNIESRFSLYSSKENEPIILQEHEKREVKIDPFSNHFAKVFGDKEISLKVEDSLGNIHESKFFPCHVPDKSQMESNKSLQPTVENGD